MLSIIKNASNRKSLSNNSLLASLKQICISISVIFLKLYIIVIKLLNLSIEILNLRTFVLIIIMKLYWLISESVLRLMNLTLKNKEKIWIPKNLLINKFHLMRQLRGLKSSIHRKCGTNKEWSMKTIQS